jgi:hypothetical protein
MRHRVFFPHLYFFLFSFFLSLAFPFCQFTLGDFVCSLNWKFIDRASYRAFTAARLDAARIALFDRVFKFLLSHNNFLIFDGG